ncbi:transglutaminase domain-containing protein [Marixanthomonas spongiae]|uniref:Transglutaminase n=1 Tax=Marixanthomonas spongiae TaxID=2174845 RepID=A0A2U0I7L3_9FLAO|nr:transglutaminase domain-containing protein [Marixanthomonas spongiae]PVW17095.1 transglutaminase [Marixanthomonas spongiae]
MKIVFTLLITLGYFQYGFSQDFRFGKVSKEELLEKEHPNDSTADAAVLYREMNTNFDYSQNDGFYLTTDVFERIKIYNKEGFDWANKKVKLYQGSGNSNEEISRLKGYTYFLKSGKIEDEKLRSDGIFEEEATEFLETVKFTMPAVSEGCVIEYKYTITSPFITNIDEYRFQEQIPVNKVALRFTAPEYFNYKMHQKGWVPFRINESGKTRTMHYNTKTEVISGFGAVRQNTKTQRAEVKFMENTYSVSMEHVPALKQEAFTNNIDNYSSSLKFELSYTKFPGSTLEMYTTTWEDVSKSIYDSDAFGDQLKRNNYFDDDIDQLLSGVSNPKEKILKIYEFAKAKMNWNSFVGLYTQEGTKSAYKKGSGNAADINLLLVAMLRYADINANPVLVSTKSNGIPMFPTRNGFNYVIAAVEDGNNTLLLDATIKEGEPNILQPELLNWQGMIVREDRTSSWVSLYPNRHAQQSTMMNLTVNKDDYSITGAAQNRFTGHYALLQRKAYRNANEEEIRKKLEENSGETEISNIEFTNLDKLYQPVALKYDFENFDAVEEIGGKLYFSPLLFLAVDENPFKVEERNYPIDFNYPMKDRYIVTVDIPEGYTVESVPESAAFALGENSGVFKYVINKISGKLQISVEFALNDAVMPAREYANIKKFFKMMIDKEQEKVVLVKA